MLDLAQARDMLEACDGEMEDGYRRGTAGLVARKRRARALPL